MIKETFLDWLDPTFETDASKYKYYLQYVFMEFYRHLLIVIIVTFLVPYYLGGYIWIPLMSLYQIHSAIGYYDHFIPEAIAIGFYSFLFIFTMALNIESVWGSYKKFLKNKQ